MNACHGQYGKCLSGIWIEESDMQVTIGVMVSLGLGEGKEWLTKEHSIWCVLDNLDLEVKCAAADTHRKVS